MNEDLPGLFRLAKNISRHSEYRIKIGAVLVKHGTPISIGFNKLKFHPKYSNPTKKTIHAEMQAILSSGKEKIRNSEIFVYREFKRTGLPALARPCEDCILKLKEFGIKRIYYTTNEFPYWNVEKL